MVENKKIKTIITFFPTTGRINRKPTPNFTPNKAGNCLKHPVYFNGTLIRLASLYRYLGFTISSSGKKKIKTIITFFPTTGRINRKPTPNFTPKS
jgi:hypothetical protein